VSPDIHLVEGIARVVGVDGATAWLEPEQTTSCGSCASAASCGSGSGSGATGIGTVANRIAARRFALDNIACLAVGERVVIGVDHRALIKGALTAYGLPLLLALGAGGSAEAAWGNDLASMAAMVAGLLLGLLAARTVAGRLGARGELEPRFLRRARPNESCNGSAA
jgi:sigma-E factor negative regulatory protein RseC